MSHSRDRCLQGRDTRLARAPGERPERAWRAAVHARHLPHDVSRQAVDDAPVRGLRHGRRDECPVSPPARRRTDGPVGRVRSADPDGLRLRSSHGGRGSGTRRCGDRQRGGSRAAVSWHLARSRLHVHDDQRDSGDSARDVYRRRRGTGRPAHQAPGHPAERHPQGIHRARLMKQKFDASGAAGRLRFHTQTGGATLTAQQPLNNVVRVAIQAMAAVLGGTQSLHTNSYDEALALPTERSATLALRTQQLLAYETGVPDVVDPLGGSWYVEGLTDKIEAAARALVEEVEVGGGSVKAIERGVFQEAIARSAYQQQRAVEEKKQVVVGVNEYVTGEPIPPIPTPDYSQLAEEQKRRLASQREKRDTR